LSFASSDRGPNHIEEPNPYPRFPGHQPNAHRPREPEIRVRRQPEIINPYPIVPGNQPNAQRPRTE
jgi:hypothetical protein